MKIAIEEIHKNQEEEIIIKCHEVNTDILELVHTIKRKSEMLLGYDGDNIHRISLGDVFYFESVDNKTFIYCETHVLESKQKLYEIEEICKDSSFFRASKSSIINVAKIQYVKPLISGRFEAKLENGEVVGISRQFVPVLKSMLDL